MVERRHEGSAVDVLCARSASRASGSLWVIEIKDIPAHPQTVPPTPENLAERCRAKVRDSLAQLVWGPAKLGRPAEPEVDELARAFGRTELPLAFALPIEDASLEPIDRVSLREILERHLKWLPLTAGMTLSLDDPRHWPLGLSVTRKP